MSSTQFEPLRGKIRGAVIEPADAEYESARKVYNGMIDKRPAAVLSLIHI